MRYAAVLRYYATPCHAYATMIDFRWRADAADDAKIFAIMIDTLLRCYISI